MIDAVIVSTARTPIGKAFRGAFNDTKSPTLLGHAITHAVQRAGIEPDRIEDAVMGSVLTAGTAGSNIARQAVLAAGLPATVAAQTIDRQCASGLMAISIAAKQIMVDGMAACAALLIASRIAESVTDYCVFCRSQTHHGLDRALGLFQASALLELGLDTTDGTGACLSWPLVHSAAALLTELSEEDVSQPAGMDAPVVQSLYDPSSPTIPGLP